MPLLGLMILTCVMDIRCRFFSDFHPTCCGSKWTDLSTSSRMKGNCGYHHLRRQTTSIQLYALKPAFVLQVFTFFNSCTFKKKVKTTTSSFFSIITKTVKLGQLSEAVHNPLRHEETRTEGFLQDGQRQLPPSTALRLQQEQLHRGRRQRPTLGEGVVQQPGRGVQVALLERSTP